MLFINIIVIAGLILVVVFFSVLFLIPTERRGKKRKKPNMSENSRQKDWKQVSLRLEKHVHALRRKIEELQKSVRNKEKQALIEEAKSRKLQEKLVQEKKWHEKENDDISKRTSESYKLRGEILKIQESFAKEHAVRLRQDRELKEFKGENDSLNNLRRNLELENARMKSTGENYRIQVAHLKAENTEFKKKREDIMWVAKTDYLRVERLLKEKEKELERVERELKRNSE